MLVFLSCIMFLCKEPFGSDAWILGRLMSSVWNAAWTADSALQGLRRHPTWGSSCICRPLKGNVCFVEWKRQLWLSNARKMVYWTVALCMRTLISRIAHFKGIVHHIILKSDALRNFLMTFLVLLSFCFHFKLLFNSIELLQRP